MGAGPRLVMIIMKMKKMVNGRSVNSVRFNQGAFYLKRLLVSSINLNRFW